MKNPYVSVDYIFECGLSTAKRNMLFHNCDPCLIDKLQVLTSGSPNYDMEANKWIIQSFCTFIEDSHRFDCLHTERVVTQAYI